MCLGLGWLPLCAGLVVFVGMCTCYIITIALNHADPLFPAISDTGIKKPEMYIFSQFFNAASILYIMTVFVRYKLVRSMMDSGTDSKRLRRMTLANCVIGVSSGVGLSLVANHPEDQSKAVHFTGATITFVAGIAYEVLDSVISFKIQPKDKPRGCMMLRPFIALISIVSLAGFVIAVLLLRVKFEELTKEEILFWQPSQEGYEAHLALSFCEWILVISFCAYFFTYVCEFSAFSSEVVTAPANSTSCDQLSIQRHRIWFLPVHLFHSKRYEVTNKPVITPVLNV